MLRIAIALLVVMWTVVGVSYWRALTAPGYATLADKTSGWLRDHGLGPIVDRAENWYYTRQSPSTRPADAGQFTLGSGSAGASIILPALPVPAGAATAPRWRAASALADGTPIIYTSAFEPDPAHPSIVTGVAIISSSATTAHFMTGTAQPRSARNTTGADVPPADIPALAAVFNSGFRFTDIAGGVYAFGREYVPLRSGEATAAIDDRGHLTVGDWGRDLTMSSHLVAARQNLALVVDNGRPLPERGTSDARWGGTHLQYQYTWRSGLGIDRDNDVIYVAGDHLNLVTLATALARAGAVRAMQLDMHTGMSAFISWHATTGGTRQPTKLLSTMSGPSTRYLTPDRRDFFYVTAGNANTRPSGASQAQSMHTGRKTGTQ